MYPLHGPGFTTVCIVVAAIVCAPFARAADGPVSASTAELAGQILLEMNTVPDAPPTSETPTFVGSGVSSFLGDNPSLPNPARTSGFPILMPSDPLAGMDTLSPLEWPSSSTGFPPTDGGLGFPSTTWKGGVSEISAADPFGPMDIRGGLRWPTMSAGLVPPNAWVPGWQASLDQQASSATTTAVPRPVFEPADFEGLALTGMGLGLDELGFPPIAGGFMTASARLAFGASHQLTSATPRYSPTTFAVVTASGMAMDIARGLPNADVTELGIRAAWLPALGSGIDLANTTIPLYQRWENLAYGIASSWAEATGLRTGNALVGVAAREGALSVLDLTKDATWWAAWRSHPIHESMSFAEFRAFGIAQNAYLPDHSLTRKLQRAPHRGEVTGIQSVTSTFPSARGRVHISVTDAGFPPPTGALGYRSSALARPVRSLGSVGRWTMPSRYASGMNLTVPRLSFPDMWRPRFPPPRMTR